LFYRVTKIRNLQVMLRGKHLQASKRGVTADGAGTNPAPNQPLTQQESE
jgi:hypothetical protein